MPRDTLTTLIADVTDAYPDPPRPVTFRTIVTAAYSTRLTVWTLILLGVLFLVLIVPGNSAPVANAVFERAILAAGAASIVVVALVYAACIWVCLRAGVVVSAQVTKTVFSHYTGPSNQRRGYTIHVTYQVAANAYTRTFRLPLTWNTIPRPGQRVALLLWPWGYHIMYVIHLVRTRPPRPATPEPPAPHRRRGRSRRSAG